MKRMIASPLSESRSAAWGMQCMAAALWLAALFPLYEISGKIFSHLLPGVEDNIGLFLCHGQALFIALAVPSCLTDFANRLATLKAMLFFLVMALSPLAVGFALASRITPLALPAACRGIAALAVFAVFCVALWAAAERWYWLVQVMLAGVGPFAGFFLRELASQRGGHAGDLTALWTPSVFFSLSQAMRAAAPSLNGEIPRWLLSVLLWLITAVACFALQPRRVPV